MMLRAILCVKDISKRSHFEKVATAIVISLAIKSQNAKLNEWKIITEEWVNLMQEKL